MELSGDTAIDPLSIAQVQTNIYLKSMLAGRISCCQGGPSDANYTADSYNAPSTTVYHVRQHLLRHRD